MSDKIRERQIYESLKSKYVGLGNSDTDRKEFTSNIKRDTYSALISHNDLLEQLSVSLNKPKNLIHNELIDKMANK